MTMAVRTSSGARLESIVNLLRAHHTQACIGKRFGVRRQAINAQLQYWSAILGKDGLCVELIFTLTDLAQELGIATLQVRQLCAGSADLCSSLPCCRPIFFTAVQTAAVCELYRQSTHPKVEPKHERCVYCNQLFVPKPSGTRKKLVCYDNNCRRRHNAEARDRTVMAGSTVQGWHVWLVEELRAAPIPADDRWVALSEARRCTGLTNIQLIWLARRAILVTRPHPTKLWRGRPVATYAMSQLTLVKIVYHSYHTT